MHDYAGEEGEVLSRYYPQHLRTCKQQHRGGVRCAVRVVQVFAIRFSYSPMTIPPSPAFPREKEPSDSSQITAVLAATNATLSKTLVTTSRIHVHCRFPPKKKSEAKAMASDKDLSVGDSANSDEEEEEEDDKADLSVESAEDAGEVESSAKVGNPYVF